MHRIISPVNGWSTARSTAQAARSTEDRRSGQRGLTAGQLGLVVFSTERRVGRMWRVGFTRGLLLARDGASRLLWALFLLFWTPLGEFFLLLAATFHHMARICSQYSTLMTLQITFFPNKGFSIGYAAHHAVLDGKTTALFMHSWASICRRGGDSTLTEEETPFYDRTSIKDPNDHEKTYINFLFELNGPNNKSLMIWDMNAPTDTMLGTFQLTRADIENMKKRVKNQWQEKQKREPAIHVSSFTITSAYVWVCLVKAKKISTWKVHLGFSVDCRARLEPPLPSTYFGNFLSGEQINADSNDLIGEDGVATTVKAIGEAIESLKEEAVKEFQVYKLFSIDKDRLFTIGGSPRFELYNTDFGWGRPRKVEMTSIDKSGAFSLSDCRDGNGGLEIGIVLKKHETEAFASLFASGLEAC
ncbi:hypothetical protein HYC85_002693 [Camellia sinensis]|uniref:Uncharacterized protein n=1 Tax=Camellia sinensis TaxID=4442 RepID=A0A7J7IAP6_CAMSI|nr:hypothetical protein HYC85_002693 [Camellia sinensis]